MKHILLGTVAALSLTTAVQADTYDLSYDGENITFTEIDETEYEHTDECWIDCGDKFNFNDVLYETKVEAEEAFTNALALFANTQAIITSHTPPKEVEKLDIFELYNDFELNRTDNYLTDWNVFRDFVSEYISTWYHPHNGTASLNEHAIHFAATYSSINHGKTRLEQGSNSGVEREIYISPEKIYDTNGEAIYTHDETFNYEFTNYNNFIDQVSDNLKTKIDGFQFQTNPNLSKNNMRIRLKEIVGTPTGFGGTSTDWIYGSDTTEIIENLATNAFSEGFRNGFRISFREGYEVGYHDGFRDGFKLGYELGVAE